MKRIILTLASAFILSASYAQTTPIQSPAKNVPAAQSVPAPQTLPAAPAEVFDFDKYLKLNKTNHDFGKLPQGPTANTEFTVKNISKDTITIENVQASCGCTVPDWTRTPIFPGKSGMIKAVYNTQGRPGSFNKSLTIRTNRGTKPVTISGEVETAPVGSVPPAQNSMIKH
jgi:Protein of unknown function (DUF1573)